MFIRSSYYELFASQHGVASRSQLLELGLTERQVDRRCQLGDLERMHRQVFRLAGTVPSPRSDLLAAVLACGPGAVASHRSAAWLWGWGEAGTVHHVTTGSRFAPLIVSAGVHRSRFIDGLTTVDGIAVTDPSRTLAELGSVCSPKEVESALDVFVGKGHIEAATLPVWLATHGARGRGGVGVLKGVLDRRMVDSTVSDSVLEAKFRQLLDRYGIDGFAFHHRLNIGGRSIEPDFVHLGARVVVELDGFAFHSSPEAFERDRQRDAALVAAGWVVLRFTWRDVVHRSNAVATQIRVVVAQRIAA